MTLPGCLESHGAVPLPLLEPMAHVFFPTECRGGLQLSEGSATHPVEVACDIKPCDLLGYRQQKFMALKHFRD